MKLTLAIVGLLLLPSFASAAVGFGTISAADNAISRTSVAVSGSNTVGIVFVSGDSASDSITSVTWGGVSMTKIAAVKTTGDRWNSAWCINSPASSATIQFNDNADNYWRNFNAYYTGTSCPVDSSNTGSNSAASALSVSTTVVAANSWLVMFLKNSSGGGLYNSSGSLTIERAENDAGGLAIADSNGTVAAGSRTGTMTKTDAPLTPNNSAIVFSLAPAAVASTFQLWPLSTF